MSKCFSVLTFSLTNLRHMILHSTEWRIQVLRGHLSILNWRIPRLLFSRGSISPSQISESNLLINQLTRSFIRESLRVIRKIILFFSLSIILQLSWRRLTRPLFTWHDFPYSGRVRNSDIDMFVRLFQYSTRVPESHCLKLSLTETTVILIFILFITFIIDDEITRQLQ